MEEKIVFTKDNIKTLRIDKFSRTNLICICAELIKHLFESGSGKSQYEFLKYINNEKITGENRYTFLHSEVTVEDIKSGLRYIYEYNNIAYETPSLEDLVTIMNLCKNVTNHNENLYYTKEVACYQFIKQKYPEAKINEYHRRLEMSSIDVDKLNIYWLRRLTQYFLDNLQKMPTEIVDQWHSYERIPFQDTMVISYHWEYDDIINSILRLNKSESNEKYYEYTDADIINIGRIISKQDFESICFESIEATIEDYFEQKCKE